MDISNNIKKAREERRITQSEIARKLGIEPTNYPRLEKRGNRLTLEQLEAIAGALGVSLVELLTGEQQEEDSSKKITELEKELAKSEQRTKDLVFRIDDFLASMLMKKAISSRVGYLQLYVDDKIESINLSEIPPELDVNNWLETRYPNSYHAEDVILTDEEAKELIKKIIYRNRGLFDLLSAIRPYIQHESWIEAIDERRKRQLE